MSEADKLGEVDRILSGRANGAAKQEVKGAGVEVATVEAVVPELPDPKSPYTAHARAANKPVYSFHCLLGAEGTASFQYVNLDSHSTFKAGEKGQVIVLRFAGTMIWEITIVGLNLWLMYDYLMQHRMSWIRKADRPFPGPDGESFIEEIRIKPIPRDPA